MGKKFSQPEGTVENLEKKLSQSEGTVKNHGEEAQSV
jgi:hypothetical protein